MFIRFGVNITKELQEKGWADFYSPDQEADVECRLDDEGIIWSRHCGTGRGCFWTEWKEVGDKNDLE